MFLTVFRRRAGGADPRYSLAGVGNAPLRGTDDLHSRRTLSKGITMSTVITGASGHLGRLVVDQLLATGTSPSRIVATGRDVDKLNDLAQGGATVRRADFADPSTLEDAFAGADAMLLVSTTTVGERFDNARNAIDAAARAGVSRMVYTSILNGSTAQMTLAEAHRRTEDYLRDSGLPFVILRNGWYLENYTDQLPMITQYHALLGSASDGLVSAASRRDYAAAAAAVLTQDGHLGATYELGGTPFTLTELAATISDVLGTRIAYQDMSVADYTAALTAAGLPPEMAAAVADADAGLARGELFTASDDLAKLIGRPATTAREAVRNAATIEASR
jgi:NAD(P)H dehydrogenase (quinone)